MLRFIESTDDLTTRCIQTMLLLIDIMVLAPPVDLQWLSFDFMFISCRTNITHLLPWPQMRAACRHFSCINSISTVVPQGNSLWPPPLSIPCILYEMKDFRHSVSASYDSASFKTHPKLTAPSLCKLRECWSYAEEETSM